MLSNIMKWFYAAISRAKEKNIKNKPTETP